MELCLFGIFLTEAYLQPYQTSMIEVFTKVVNDYSLSVIFAKRSVINVWQGPRCVSVFVKVIASNYNNIASKCGGLQYHCYNDVNIL